MSRNCRTPFAEGSITARAGRPHADLLHISLPTDGPYAQTIMNECGALEEHYGNTDWALDDPVPAFGRHVGSSAVEERWRGAGHRG